MGYLKSVIILVEMWHFLVFFWKNSFLLFISKSGHTESESTYIEKKISQKQCDQKKIAKCL